jgi:hypothetical protein
VSGLFSSVSVLLLVSGAPNPNDVKAGWVAFGLFIALGVAVFLLWLSFRKQLKKIDFEEEPDPRADRKTPPPTKPS